MKKKNLIQVNDSIIKNWDEAWECNAVIKFWKIPLGNMCKKKLSWQISIIYYFHEKKIVLTNTLCISDQRNVWDLQCTSRLITKLKRRHNGIFICWEYHSPLAKKYKKNSLCSGRLLASTLIFKKLWTKLYSQYLCAFLIQLIHDTNYEIMT